MILKYIFTNGSTKEINILDLWGLIESMDQLNADKCILIVIYLINLVHISDILTAKYGVKSKGAR